MTQWPTQRNVYTLVPPMSSIMNKSADTTHVLTTHNTNTPSRCSSTATPTTATVNAFDDSLTNLSWLHDINILKRTMPMINSSSSCSSSSSTNSGNNQTNSTKRKDLPASLISTSSSSIGAVYPNDIDDTNDSSLTNTDDDEQWKMYKNNPQAKPVYSYSQLILLAMRQAGHEKMTLQMIYEWIADNFPYFKQMEPTWQNSIRHNLSLNKCFIKVARTKKEAGGKGGFWKLSPDFQRQRSEKRSSPDEQQTNSSSSKRIRSSKRSVNSLIKSETWSDPILPCISNLPTTINHSSTYVRMPSSFLSPISSPDSLPVHPFYHHQQQQMSDFSSVLTPSPSTSPSSLSSAIAKQNFLPTKLDETDMLLLDSVSFDWDAYLCETPNDIDVQPLLSTKTEQELFNDFNAALSDLTYSAETAAAGGDSSAFDGFDYSSRQSTFNSLFEDDEQQPALKVKGRGIKRPSWWFTNEGVPGSKLPSLETAFDLKFSK